MNIHVAPFRPAFTHTCCQGQISGLTIRPDAARWRVKCSHVPNCLSSLITFQSSQCCGRNYDKVCNNNFFLKRRPMCMGAFCDCCETGRSLSQCGGSPVSDTLETYQLFMNRKELMGGVGASDEVVRNFYCQ